MIADGPDRLYVELMKQVLLGQTETGGDGLIPWAVTGLRGAVADRVLAGQGVITAKREPVFGDDIVEEGLYWKAPPRGYTMIGRKRLDHLGWCVETVLREGVPGQLIETGVWRGGATLLMRAVLAAHGDGARKVFVADSFAGLPTPDVARHPADSSSTLHMNKDLAIPLTAVRANFERFGLLDDQVEFVEGWFRDTLPGLSEQTWALIRLDGDLYESTMDGLEHLYPQLAPGGFLIVDDYRAYESCRTAVEDYRNRHSITTGLEAIDWSGVYWRRPW
ncbi:MAG: TylF/MycF/NovP-related O-methyltransferase [Acidimicrobiales bacterium]